MRRPIFRTYRHGDFDAAALAETRRATATSSSVCLPARDEAATVGPIVEQIRAVLVDGCGLVDEVLVMDDHSTDDTARIAGRGRRSGGRPSTTCCRSSAPARARARRSTSRSPPREGDLIAWCDADIREFAPHFVVGLVGPLLTRSDIAFVKGFYDRPVDGEPARRRAGHRADGPTGDRGPVPAPGLDRAAARRASTPARRSLLERLPFVQGYGVDLGLLIDIAEVEGTEAIAQVDLGLRRHRNRSLDELGPQALAVLQTALGRGRRPARGRGRHPRAARSGARGGARRRAARPRRRLRLPPPHRVDRPVQEDFA